MKRLRAACLRAAAADTSCWPAQYRRLQKRGRLPSPLWRHCGVVALVVRATLGGSILTGMVDDTPHYWNRLPDGREVDLTSCQFGGDGLTPLTKGANADAQAKGPLGLHDIIFASRVHFELNRKQP